MLLDQQTSGSPSCLPVPGAAETVFATSLPALEGSALSAGGSKGSSIQSMSSLVAATPLSLRLKLQCQNTFVPAAVSRTCVAASLPVRRCSGSTTFAVSSPLQPNPLAAAGAAPAPNLSMFISSNPTYSGDVRTWNCQQSSTPTCCPSSHAVTLAAGNAFWTSRYAPETYPGCYAAEDGTAVGQNTAGAIEAYYADSRAVPPSEYSTALVHDPARGPQDETPPTAADYTRVSATGFIGTAAAYSPSGGGAPMSDTPITPCAGDFRLVSQLPERCQKTCRNQSRCFSGQHSRLFSEDVCGEDQQQYLLQPTTPPQKQRPQVKPLDERRTQICQEKKQHPKGASLLTANLQQQRPSLPIEQHGIEQAQLLEQGNLEHHGPLQQLPEEDSDFTARAGIGDLTRPKEALNGHSESENRCRAPRQDVDRSASLYASQTTAPSLSASCISARTYSAADSSPTHNAQLPCNTRRITALMHDSNAPLAATAVPLTGTPSDHAQSIWFSPSESGQRSTTSETQIPAKPAAGAARAPVFAGPVPQCTNIPGLLPVFSNTSSPNTRLAEAVSAASTANPAAAPSFAGRSTPAEITMAHVARTTTQNNYGLPCGERTPYQNMLPRSCSSGIRTIASSAAQEQWQQTHFSFVADASSATGITQPLTFQKQELQPPVQQQHQQHSGPSDIQQHKLTDVTQSQGPLYQVLQNQRQHVEPAQRPLAHQPLRQQEQDPHLHPQTALSPKITHSPHHNLYMRQRTVPGEQDRFSFKSQQSVQQQHTFRQVQGLYQSQEPLQDNNQRVQQPLQPPNVQYLQPPRLSVLRPDLQQHQTNDSHYQTQRQNLTPAAQNAASGCSTPQISPMSVAGVPTAASHWPRTPSLTSGNYGVAGHFRIEVDTSRDGSDTNKGNTSAHINSDIADGHTPAYTQCQQLSQPQRFPPHASQQQVLPLQHREEHLHPGDERVPSVDGHSGYIGFPTFYSSPESSLSPVLKPPSQLQQQHAMHPGPPGSGQAFYVRQPCQQGLGDQHLNQGTVCTPALTCQPGHGRVEPSIPQVYSYAGHPHPVHTPSSVPANFTLSSTVSNFPPRPSCLSAPSPCDSNFSHNISTSLAPGRAPAPERSALQPDAPIGVHRVSSQPGATPIAGDPVSAEDMNTAASAPPFSATVPCYVASPATPVEQLSLSRSTHPNLSFYGGNALSPSQFSASSDPAHDCVAYQDSKNTSHSTTASCVSGGVQAETWNLTQTSRSSNSSTTKANVKRIGTPQQKGTSRRCLQYRQQQHRSESPAGSNTILHPLRAVRGLPMQQRKLFRNLARQTPRVQGLTFDHNQIRWISYWKNSQGKQIQRHFPVSRFGFIEARRLALEERNRILGWPLDTDEAADAIAELSKTAEQSLQLLLQQSLSAGVGGNSDGAPAAAALGNAEVMLGDVTAGVSSHAGGATALAKETNAEELPVQSIEAAPAEESSGALQMEVVGRENALPIETPGNSADSAEMKQHPLKTAVAQDAEETLQEQCYFSTAEATANSDRIDTTTGATAGVALPPLPLIGALPTAEDGMENGTLEGTRHSSSAEIPSKEEALKSNYGTSEETNQTCTYGFQEIATRTSEKRHNPLQYQHHRASVISVSTTDQERVYESFGNGPHVTTTLFLGQACGYTATCQTASYSALDTGTTLDGGNAGLATSGYEDVHQRARSAASTNVEEDIEVTALAVEGNAHPAKRQQQQEWQLSCNQEQHIYPATGGASINSSNCELHSVDVTSRSMSQHVPLQKQEKQQHQELRQNEEAFYQQRWPLQDQPLQQKEELQGMGANTPYCTNLSRRLTYVSCSDTSNVNNILSSADAAEALSPGQSYSQKSQSAEHDYECTSSSMRYVQQQHRFDVQVTSPHSPVQKEEQLMMFPGKQQLPSDTDSRNNEALLLPGQRQVPQISQSVIACCTGPSTPVALDHVSDPPANVSSTTAAAATPCSASGEPSMTTTPFLNSAAGNVDNGAAAVLADASIPRSSKTAACTSLRSTQQPRQRERSRKKRNDTSNIHSNVQTSAAAITAALAPNTTKPSTSLAAAAGEMTELCPSTLQLAEEEHSASTEEVANTIRMERANLAETAASSENVSISFEKNSHNSVAAAMAPVPQKVAHVAASGSFTHMSQTGCCVEGTAASIMNEKNGSNLSNVCNNGIRSMTKSRCSQTPGQQGAFYNGQTVFWNSAAPCAGWSQWQYRGQQQGRGQPLQQVTAQGGSFSEKGDHLSLQQQTNIMNVAETSCVSQQQQQRPLLGRQKKQQLTSTKKKAMLTRQTTLSPAALSTSTQMKTAAPDVVTAAVAAAAAKATAAAVAAATATAAAAVSSSVSLKRKVLPETEGGDKRAQSSNSRKSRRKCRPEEQRKHALFSAAAAAARQAVDTLPEPIIHPQLLNRHFHPSALQQYVQPFPVHTLNHDQHGSIQRTRQGSNSGQPRLRNSTSAEHKTKTLGPSQSQPEEHLHWQQQMHQKPVGQQQQLLSKELHCQQQGQQKHAGRRQPLLSITDLASEGNSGRSVVPTPPQTPSCAAPYDFAVEGSRSTSCCPRKDPGSCFSNTASRHHVLSHSRVHANSVNTANNTDRSSHSISNMHSTTSCSIPAVRDNSVVTCRATSGNDSSSTSLDFSRCKSVHHISCSSDSETLSGHSRPVSGARSSCVDASRGTCNDGHSSIINLCTEDSWLDGALAAKNVLLPDKEATRLSNQAKISSATARSIDSKHRVESEEVKPGTPDSPVDLKKDRAGAREQMICSTSSLPSPAKTEGHSLYMHNDNIYVNSNYIGDNGPSGLSQCSEKKHGTNSALVHPLVNWATDSSMSGIRVSSQELRESTGKEDAWTKDQQQNEQQQHPRHCKKKDRRLGYTARELQPHSQQAHVVAQSQQEYHDAVDIRKHQYAGTQQQEHRQLEEQFGGLRQETSKKTCDNTAGTPNRESRIEQSLCDNQANGEREKNQLIRKGPIQLEMTEPVSGQACTDSKILHSQQHMSFVVNGTKAPSTQGCLDVATEDACINNSCISRRRSISGTGDYAAVPCSGVSHSFSSSNGSSDTSSTAGRVDNNATSHIGPGEAISTDVKNHSNRTPLAVISSSPSCLVQNGYLSGSCWLGGPGATDTCASARRNAECYTGLCVKQQKHTPPTQKKPDTNDTGGGAMKTETEATQDPMQHSTWAPRPLRSPSCTSHHVRPHPPSKGPDGRALCVQSCPAKLGTRESLPATHSCPTGSESSHPLTPYQQKQQHVLFEQHGGSKRHNSAINSAESDNPYNCRELASVCQEGKTGQALLRCSPYSSGEEVDKKVQNISNMPQQSFSSIQQKGERDREQQPQKEQQHSATRQKISQEAVETSTCLPALSQALGKTGESSQALMSSSILLPFSFCLSSSKSRNDELETPETPVQTPCPAPLSSSPCCGKSGSSESRNTRDDPQASSRNRCERMHKDKYAQQQSRVVQNRPSAAAAAATDAGVAPPAAANRGVAAPTCAAATRGAAIPSSSLLPTAPAPTSANNEPPLQTYLEASGDFFQLLPSPHRTSCDCLGCDGNHFPPLQPRCSRSSTVLHSAADVSLISPSSGSSAAILTGARTGAAASVNETYNISAASGATEGISAPIRAVTATTSVKSSAELPFNAANVFSAPAGSRKEKCHSIHTTTPSLSPQQQQQRSSSAPTSSMMLLGSQDYYTRATPSLNTASAAQHQQQLSPLWTATVPLPALFRTSAASSIDSFSALMSVASDTGTKSAAATQLVSATAPTDPHGGTGTSPHCTNGTSNFPLCDREKKPNLFSADSKPSIESVDADKLVHSGLEAVKDDELVWRRALGARDTTAAADGAVNSDEAFPPTVTTTEKQVEPGGTNFYKISSSGKYDQTCFGGPLLSPTTAMRRTSSHMVTGDLLRSRTLGSESVPRSPCGIESTRPNSSAVDAHDLPTSSLIDTATHPIPSVVETADRPTFSLINTATYSTFSQINSAPQSVLTSTDTASHASSSLSDTVAAASLPPAAREFSRTAAADIGPQEAGGLASTPERGQKMNKGRDSPLSVLKHSRTTEAQREAEASCRLNATECAFGGTQDTSKVPAALNIGTNSEELTSQITDGLRARMLTGNTAEASRGVGEDERQPQLVGRALWRSTTATNDATHGTEEGGTVFPNTCSWSLVEKLGGFPCSSVGEENCTSTRKEQQHPLLPPSNSRSLSGENSDIHRHTTNKEQNSFLCSPGMIPTDTTRKPKGMFPSSCPLGAEDDVSPISTAAADMQQTTPPKKQMLLPMPFFNAQARISDEFFLQRPDPSLPPAADARTPWTATAIANSSTHWNTGPPPAVSTASWTAAAAGERGWSPLFSFAAVPPSPVDATGRFMRLSSPRISGFTPLSATAATTCSSSSTTEADGGVPFGFILSDRSMEGSSNNDDISATHEKALQGLRNV